MTKVKKRGPINFNKGFSEAVAANQKEWVHDRTTTVGASEVFDCWRSTFFKKRAPEMADAAEEQDPEWGHAERGNLIENEYVVPTLRTMFGEDSCLFMGEQQRTLVDGRLSATPDGLVIEQSSDALAEYGVEDIGSAGELATEVKTFGGEFAAPKKKVVADPKDETKNVTRYEAKPKHVGQVNVQLGMFRRKTNYQPDYGVVLYVNPVNLKDIRPAVVKYDENVYKRAKERAEAVFDPNKTAKDFPAEGLITNGCQYCAFVDACNKVEMSRLPKGIKKTDELDPAVQETIREKAKEVVTLRKQAKKLEADKKAAEADLKTLLFDNDTTRAAQEGWSATVSKQNGRKSTDVDRIVEDTGIDLEDYQTEGNPFFVLRVKYEGVDVGD